MKKIYDENIVELYLKRSRYANALEKWRKEFCVIEYEKGELVTSPWEVENLFQVVVRGNLNIYLVRDDGERYSLSTGGKDYLLGDMDFFYPDKNIQRKREHDAVGDIEVPLGNNVYTEAEDGLVCLCMKIEKWRKHLNEDVDFLRMICESLSEKMKVITTLTAAPSTLEERVLSYMRYKCQGGVLKGIERAAFHLHCSSRQLQRILNKFEQEGTVKKIGKGTYQRRAHTL